MQCLLEQIMMINLKKVMIKKINLRNKKIEDAELDYEWRVDPELSALDATVPINISLREFRDHLKDEIKYPVQVKRN